MIGYGLVDEDPTIHATTALSPLPHSCLSVESQGPQSHAASQADSVDNSYTGHSQMSVSDCHSVASTLIGEKLTPVLLACG